MRHKDAPRDPDSPTGTGKRPLTSWVRAPERLNRNPHLCEGDRAYLAGHAFFDAISIRDDRAPVNETQTMATSRRLRLTGRSRDLMTFGVRKNTDSRRIRSSIDWKDR